MNGGGYKMKFHHINFIALAAIIISLTMLPFVSGCAAGVSEAEYNALRTELQTTKAELETLKAQGAGAAGSADMATIAAYAEINDRCLDAFRVLYGEPSKYGYSKSEVGRWISDLDAKIHAVNDPGLTYMWNAYVSATPGAEQLKKGVSILTYLSDKMKSLTVQ